MKDNSDNPDSFNGVEVCEELKRITIEHGKKCPKCQRFVATVKESMEGEAKKYV